MQTKTEDLSLITKTRDKLSKESKAIKRKNINNVGLINKLADKLSELADEEVKSFAEAEVFDILSLTYGLSREFGENLSLVGLEEIASDLIEAYDSLE